MTEDHSAHHDLDDEDGLTPQEVAAMRWQAIQGFNAAPGISPLASRLGIALICHMDAKRRICFVGELRLSIELGAHILSIQKAKRQLREAGLTRPAISEYSISKLSYSSLGNEQRELC